MDYKDDQGNPFKCIGDPLNSGGEGYIYETNRRGYVAKVYKKLPSSRHIAKLEVMIQNPPQEPSRDHVTVAWPTRLVFNTENKCVGFLMPKVPRSVQIIQVYNPRERKKVLPKFDWLYLHCTALNLAKIVHALHFKDYIIGDIKPQNILVDNQARVSVVDTDSFQVKDPNNPANVYRCSVTTEGFTPPEMLGLLEIDPNQITQTKSNDRYRLALIIYHLLLMQHPFNDGVWENQADQPSQIESMKKGVWLYDGSNSLKSGRLTIPIDILDPPLKNLFMRCFNDGHHDLQARPSARDWVDTLESSIQLLKECIQVDTHKYFNTSKTCYWCNRKQDLKVDIFPGDLPTQTSKPISTIKIPITKPVKIPVTKPVKIPVTYQPTRVKYKNSQKLWSGTLITVIGVLVILNGSGLGVFFMIWGIVILLND